MKTKINKNHISLIFFFKQDQTIENIYSGMLDCYSQPLLQNFDVGKDIVVNFEYSNNEIKDKKQVMIGNDYFDIAHIKGYKSKKNSNLLNDCDIQIKSSLDNAHIISKILTKSDSYNQFGCATVHILNTTYENFFKQIYALDDDNDYVQIRGDQAFPNSDTHNIFSVEIISTKITREAILQLVFFIFNKYPEKLYMLATRRTYASKVDDNPLFPDRQRIDWFSYVQTEILPEDLPEAYKLIYLPNRGTIIISTEEMIDFERNDHKRIIHTIESKLYEYGLLALTSDEASLSFIPRNKWKK